MWDANFDALVDAEIDTVILNVALDASQVGSSAEARPLTAYYPTSLPGYEQAADSSGDPVDVVGSVLREARERGLKVWLGLGVDFTRWYGDDDLGIPTSKGDAAWLASQVELNQSIAAELLDRYSEFRGDVTGWYFPGEDTPWGISHVDTLHDFYVNLGDSLDELDPSKQFMISPYYHQSGGRTPDQFADYLSEVLRNTQVDVVAPQTCADLKCGLPNDPLDSSARASTIAEWIAATADGVKRAGTDAQIWANIELFGPYDPNAATLPFMAVADIVDTMRATEPFVDAFTSWSYTNQWSPTATWGASWWADAYTQYVKTGSLPLVTPPAPTDTHMSVNGNKATFTWKIQSGSRVAHLELLQVSDTGIAVLALPWNDVTTATVSFDSNAEYILRARTAAGARSETVTLYSPGPRQTNWASGREYDVDSPASANYPDTGGSELTDGIRGETWSDSAWQGRYEVGLHGSTVVVDLGATKPVQAISLGALDYPPYAIHAPSTLQAATSHDGIHWTPYGELEVAPTSGPGTYSIRGLANARFVQLSTSGTGHTFLDELQVVG